MSESFEKEYQIGPFSFSKKGFFYILLKVFSAFCFGCIVQSERQDIDRGVYHRFVYARVWLLVRV